MGKLVLLLAGIPGAGKSTLAKLILRRFHYLAFGKVSLLSFDEIGRYVQWDNESFHLIRYNALLHLMGLLSSCQDSPDDSCDNPHVVIVDDLMYLRSMRRQVYVICRDCNVKLLTIFVDTSPGIAKERNTRRIGRERICDETMERIIHSFEGPSNGMIYDRNYTRVILDDLNSLDHIVDDIFDNIFRTLRSGDCATCTSAADRQHLEAPKSAMKMIDDSIRKFVGQIMPFLHRIEGAGSIGKVASVIKSELLKYARLCSLDDYENDNAFVQHIRNIYLAKLKEAITTMAKIDNSQVEAIFNHFELS